VELIGNILLFVVSLAALVKASDWFVSGAEVVGRSAGISPFIIGVTLVAFGTSLPELATSIAAVFSGSSEIVIGNVVGSNITNILLVLGLSTVIGKEIIIDKSTTDSKVLMLLASAFLLYFTLNDGMLDFFEALMFMMGMVLFLISSIKDKNNHQRDNTRASVSNYVMMIGGVVVVYVGAHFTILYLERISEYAGISNEVIALTVVALGTSLPEIVVSVVAVQKGKSDIAIGNVLGSNIFNTFIVMGIPGLLSYFKRPGHGTSLLTIPESVIDFSLPMMVAVTIIFCFMFVESKINRSEGWMLILLYVFFVYMTFHGSLVIR
jgi:cation:H+ antiporter